MLVVEKKRKLVINTKRHGDVMSVIPHAKLFDYNGAQLLAMNHGIEETLILRNLGFKKTPSPILSYYDFPARFAAMAHQKTTAAFLCSNKRALCLNAPGTGKSISALWAADYLMLEGVIKTVLIVAPLSTLKPVWAMELAHHLPHRNTVVIVGTKDKRERLLSSAGLQYAIINHDGFTTMQKELAGKFDLVIYDEATALKTPTSRRYRTFAKWVQINNPWLWLMTGTPIAQNPTDAWTLSKLVNCPIVPSSFTAFKELVMRKITMFKWAPREDALLTCKKVLQPSIRFSLDECMDLPETIYLDHKSELSADQAKAFKSMQKDCVSVLSEGTATAANAAVMFSKLLQICTGAVYDENGDVLAIDATDRCDTLQEVLQEVGGKCIVFVPFRGVQSYLFDMLTKAGYDVALVNGSVGKKDRDMIFDAFQNTDKYNVLLAHPQVAAHGLTLTRSQDVIWYAPIYSLEQYEQANARIRRLTTSGKTRVHHLYSTSFEKELYNRLQHKQRTLNDFLTLVRGTNE